MNYTIKKLNDYFIHIIKTSKFKKNIVKFYFRSPINDKKEELKRDILCNLLVLGTEHYLTKRELEIKCEDLFGANISMNNIKSGKFHIFSASISFLDEKYILEKITDEAISFLKEILFHPKLENGIFDEQLVSLAKNMYLEEINSTPDDPSSFSIIKMRSHVDYASNYAFDPYFYLEDIKKITAKDLYECYQNLLQNSEIDIMVIGNIDDQIVTAFDNLPVCCIHNDDSFFDNVQSNQEKKNVIEEGNYNQSKLAICYELQNLSDFEKKYVLYVFSYILGGSSDSLIFKKLRQDHSLCYYANSSYLFFYQVLEIVAGIQSDNYETAVSLIKEAVQEIMDGHFDIAEVKKAQVTYQSAWTEMLDSPSSIMNMYLSHKYYGLDLTDERIKNIWKVKKEDIINVAKKLKLNTIYLLKGINEND